MANLKTKPWYLSSTLWINAIPLIVVILEEALLGGVIPAKYIVYVTVVLNIINRFRGQGQVVKPLTLK